MGASSLGWFGAMRGRGADFHLLKAAGVAVVRGRSNKGRGIPVRSNPVAITVTRMSSPMFGSITAPKIVTSG